MTELPNGTPPSLEEFLNRARYEFEFVDREFGFREEPILFEESPYLNDYAVWFASPTTRVVIEGIN